MKTKKFCWILLLNLLVLTAGAEPYETVVLKNGSVLEGYISSNPQLSSSASFLRLNVLSSLN